MRFIAHLIATIMIAFSSPAIAGTVISTVPSQPDPSANYLLYLHGRGVDDGSWSSKRAYDKNVQALSERGFVVISEARKKGAIKKFPRDHEKYAQKIANEVNKLLEAGVPAGNVVVAGYSRGGVIAQISSGLIGNSDVKFVIMAGCIAGDGKYKKAIPTILKRHTPKLKGQFLSLRDDGDKNFGSCVDYFMKASAKPEYKEIILSTGKGHSAFREPADEWLKPIVDWSGVPSAQ
jgi:hypothetical protein